MLPLRDTIPARKFPAAVWALVAVNTLIFLYQVSLPPWELEAFIYLYGMVPGRLTEPAGLERYWPTVFTSMFLHGGWLHLIGNMWFLWVFGDNVEDRLGTPLFLVFYLLGGVAAALVQVLVDPGSPIPAVGASGAISAVLGGYLVMFPQARVISLFILIIFPFLLEVPAALWIGLWFFQQWLNGLAALQLDAAQGGVAWWAHIGGFVFGVIAALPLLLQPRRSYHYGYDREWPFA
jgi:membrane associated rhomboid family serine protease